jgi:hypothetical protein
MMEAASDRKICRITSAGDRHVGDRKFAHHLVINLFMKFAVPSIHNISISLISLKMMVIRNNVGLL